LLFLVFLAFNKTSFTQYHNQSLQHLTLRVKSGTVAFESEAMGAFAAKTRNSFVYNFNFLLCEAVQADYEPQPQDIVIRIEGSELNNFGLYLPVWSN
jgi:hypothetical protein